MVVADEVGPAGSDPTGAPARRRRPRSLSAAAHEYRRARRWWRKRATRTGLCPPEGKGLNARLRRGLRQVGFDVHRLRDPSVVRLTKSTLLFELDDEFRGTVADGVVRAESGPKGDGEGAVRVTQRLYNLIQMVGFTRGVGGLVVECGCFRGLSSYLLCRYLAAETPSFTGASFHVFDSFEGLSPLSDHDTKRDPRVKAGMFAASLDDVRRTLADFPDISYHQGWIPESLAGAPDGPYRLVHVDLDLHDPTRAALEFFYPRLAPGGAVVCDDFGSVRWPGARTAVEGFCAETGARLLRLSSGQALVMGPAPS